MFYVLLAWSIVNTQQCYTTPSSPCHDFARYAVTLGFTSYHLIANTLCFSLTRRHHCIEITVYELLNSAQLDISFFKVQTPKSKAKKIFMKERKASVLHIFILFTFDGFHYKIQRFVIFLQIIHKKCKNKITRYLR